MGLFPLTVLKTVVDLFVHGACDLLVTLVRSFISDLPLVGVMDGLSTSLPLAFCHERSLHNYLWKSVMDIFVHGVCDP